MAKKTLIVIVGPTAIGKTNLAIGLAQYFNTEIVSADSRQFFKEMNIGTAKPTITEQNTAKHHFIDSHSIHQFFSTGDFEIESLKVLEAIFSKKDIAIAVGGSGLYVNALCEGLDDLPETDLKIREQLNQLLAKEGIDSIRLQLQKVDPKYYDSVDQNNPQRMIRGLEMFLSTGIQLSSLLTHQKKERNFNIIKIGLNMDRSELYNRINLRVDEMVKQGLLEEVKSLLTYKHLNALKTVGYTELFDFLDHKISFEEAIAKIKQNTRRFAKRQLTWFNRDPQIIWFNPNQFNEIKEFLVQKIK